MAWLVSVISLNHSSCQTLLCIPSHNSIGLNLRMRTGAHESLNLHRSPGGCVTRTSLAKDLVQHDVIFGPCQVGHDLEGGEEALGSPSVAQRGVETVKDGVELGLDGLCHKLPGSQVDADVASCDDQ